MERYYEKAKQDWGHGSSGIVFFYKSLGPVLKPHYTKKKKKKKKLYNTNPNTSQKKATILCVSIN
jgi:hypothetical protein